MSLRHLGTRLFRHGQGIIKHLCRRDFNTGGNIGETANALVAGAGPPSQRLALPRSFVLRTVGLHARRILVDTVLNRVTNSYAAELRKKAAKRFLFGDSVPFLAFVGVSLASGTGIITKEEELEGVCWEIREAVSKINWNQYDVNIDHKRFENEPITVNNLSFARPIAKGANAVVYSARLDVKDDLNKRTEDAAQKESFVSKTLKKFTKSKKNVEAEDALIKYPLAVKMMFNYDIQSSAMAILKAMYKETIPARMYYSNVGIADWEIDFSNRKRHLPPHPNVVAMYSVFTDYVPQLQDAIGLYPAALPHRIYPDGEGRNMSLFLIMKRYNASVNEYLQKSSPTTRTSLLLFAQLLEGIAHLNAHGVAHRDLKSDNLLLDISETHAPILVISDFGCCLADKSQGLTISFPSYEIDRGGNSALMAPEIICQTPGTFSMLNYSKSDLWAAGAIGYEIFGHCNPFYDGENWSKLRNTTYQEEDLPELPEEVPLLVRCLIKNLLQRNPRKRLDSEVAANVLQLLLWAPSYWLRPGSSKLPNSSEILQWLLCLTTKLLCEGRLHSTGKAATGLVNISTAVSAADGGGGQSIESTVYKTGRRTYTEYSLISSFLIRAKLANVKAALSWIHDTI